MAENDIKKTEASPPPSWGQIIAVIILLAIGFGIYGMFDKAAYSPLTTLIWIVVGIIIMSWTWLSDLVTGTPTFIWWVLLAYFFYYGLARGIENRFDIIDRKLEGITDRLRQLGTKDILED